MRTTTIILRDDGRDAHLCYTFDVYKQIRLFREKLNILAENSYARVEQAKKKIINIKKHKYYKKSRKRLIKTRMYVVYSVIYGCEKWTLKKKKIQ